MGRVRRGRSALHPRADLGPMLRHVAFVPIGTDPPQQTDCPAAAWSLNSTHIHGTHIHGTHVPVEEPSTASKPDSCSAQKVRRLVGNVLAVPGPRHHLIRMTLLAQMTSDEVSLSTTTSEPGASASRCWPGSRSKMARKSTCGRPAMRWS